MNAVLLPLLSLFPVAADDDFREFKGHEGPTRVVRFTPDGTKQGTPTTSTACA
jgi:hypothetical protein